MSLKDRLVEFVRQKLNEKGLALESERLEDDSSLIKAGLLDSVDIVELATWIEHQIGEGGVDLSTCDIAAEWDTFTTIVAFVEKHRKS